MIYIDPPFDVGADFKMEVKVGDQETYTKSPNVLEEIAYRDTWGRGKDSFLSMLHERLVLMHRLLTRDGTLFLHMGPKLAAHCRILLDEVFGSENMIADITWQRHDPHNDAVKRPGNISDRILWYAKNEKYYYDSDIERTSLSASALKEYSLFELD